MAELGFEVRVAGEGFGQNTRITRITGTERLGALYDFELHCVMPHDEFDAEKLIGGDTHITWARGGVDIRTLRGLAIELDDLGEHQRGAKTDLPIPSDSPRLRSFRVRVMPTAYRLTLVETQEVFLDKSVLDLVKDKLSLAGIEDLFESRTMAAYPKREFVTQYRESDLAFLSRLLEHEGITYFFEDDGEKERLVLSDQNSGFGEPREVQFDSRQGSAGIVEMIAEHRVTPGVYIVSDFNYRRAELDLAAQSPIEGGLGGGIIEYGSHHKSPEEGKALVKIRAEEVREKQLVYTGRARVSECRPGARLKVTGHPTLGDVDMVITEVRHESKGGESAAADTYEVSYRAIPADRTYRPPRATPKPKIYGIVNGLIDDIGTKSERFAQMDEDGRYIVRILFDTADASGRFASRWVRMAQPHVGPGYGMHFPLKPGVEVLLSFIDGDPDRPIIVGAVPNVSNPSPVNRAENTLNRLKSESGVVIEFGDRRLDP
jgi:type VI secretion system secreted protein VgrG